MKTPRTNVGKTKRSKVKKSEIRKVRNTRPTEKKKRVGQTHVSCWGGSPNKDSKRFKTDIEKILRKNSEKVDKKLINEIHSA